MLGTFTGTPSEISYIAVVSLNARYMHWKCFPSTLIFEMKATFSGSGYRLCELQLVQKPSRITRSACSLSLSVESDTTWYSFGNGEGLFVETRHSLYPLKRPIPEW